MDNVFMISSCFISLLILVAIVVLYSKVKEFKDLMNFKFDLCKHDNDMTNLAHIETVNNLKLKHLNENLLRENSYLKARLEDYEKDDSDTNFIRYMGETYRITEVCTETHTGDLKRCSVESYMVEETFNG